MHGHFRHTPAVRNCRSFRCVLLLNQIYLRTVYCSTIPLQIYLINLLWKLGLGLGLDLELHYFSIFTENNEIEHLIFREFHGR